MKRTSYQTNFHNYYNIRYALISTETNFEDSIFSNSERAESPYFYSVIDKRYKISYLLRGKRGLIYAVILLLNRNEIYVPCIYSHFTDKTYEIKCCTFPNINKYKRSVLYNFINHYNYCWWINQIN